MTVIYQWLCCDAQDCLKDLNKKIKIEDIKRQKKKSTEMTEEEAAAYWVRQTTLQPSANRPNTYPNPTRLTGRG